MKRIRRKTRGQDKENRGMKETKRDGNRKK